MNLSHVLDKIGALEVFGDSNVSFSGIAYHTDNVSQGSCFVAIRGTSVDGHQFVKTAIRKGAKVVISSKPVEVVDGVTNVVVKDERAALAIISAAFFGEPSKSFKLIGVTGTNGKTTVTFLLESIFKAAGYNPGIIGTVENRYGSVSIKFRHTTPESYDLQKLFRDMLDYGVNAVAIEVSSHALDQKRVEGVHFDGAVFTNLTQDHLDYHLDMERYKEAKFSLFEKYLPQSAKRDVWASVNIDDSVGRELLQRIKYKAFTFSSKGREADVTVVDSSCSLDGTRLVLRIGKSNLKIASRLVGRHNASNIAAAASAAFAIGIEQTAIKNGVESLLRVPGRLEAVPNSKGIVVLVDYAHTPDAIRNVLSSIRELNPRKIITVFGCGGDRDKTKRPLMGYEAALLSDALVITSDNPRSENPIKIIGEILEGVRRVGLKEGVLDGRGYLTIEDRREAIRRAIELASPGDVVLIAGKGHEDYQIVGSERRHFSDFEVVREFLN